MTDDENNQTRSHATLGDELRSVLRADAGWLTRNALLNRCELARDADELELELKRLFTQDLIQRRAGSVGLEYAALGTPLPKWEPRDARGPASSAETLVQTAPAPRADIAAIRQVNVQRRLDAVRDQMVAMFQAQPLRSRSEFDAALGRSQPIVSRYLRSMREEGLIKPVGNGTAVKFQWLGDIGPDAPVGRPVAAVQPDATPDTVPDSAPAAAPPPLASAARYGLFDNGSLVIDRGHQRLELSMSETHRLVKFLAFTCGDDLAFTR